MSRIFKITICLLVLSIIPVNVCFSQSDNKALFEKKYIQSTMLKVAEWQLNHPKEDPRRWTNGVLYTGIVAAYETTKSKKIYQSMLDMCDSVRWKPNDRWYHADDVAISQMYIDIYRKEKKQYMIQATIDTVKKFISTPYPTEGTIKWWWCDALYMAPPTMVKLGMTTKNDEFLKKSDEYYKECYDLLYNQEEHLFARDLSYVIKNDGQDRWEANGKKIFWSRGNAWVIGGLARVLQELPKNYPQRPFYENLFKELAARIVSLQPSDGLWRASLLDPDSYPGGEVSGSGLFCYALAWGINNKLLDKATYLPAVTKTWIGLTRCVNDEGRVGWVQPVGAEPRSNFGEDSWAAYGTGAFLLAASEVIKLKL
ncbi:MAG: glycoside hydrolase family 88 protein [Tannerella sp.]|jgi:rhamnogalacturonyl hydrolase YesR|nr:glycoside hydrolase family 88 protein [Tannerella sp.]